MFFRHNEDFTAGLYSQFTPIFLQLARFLPTEYVRHRSYADVHSGSDLWENVEPVDKNEARPFRQHGKMFNTSEWHESNAKILGITDNCPKMLENLRQTEKTRFNELKSKMKQCTTDLTNFTTQDETEFESWYRPVKNIPKRLINDTVQPAIFENNSRHIADHWETCTKTIEKFLKSGAIKLMPESYVPDLSATFVLANADSAHKKPRACYDGGPYKVSVGFTPRFYKILL